MAKGGPVGVVSTFPPAVCGVGTYAAEQVRAMRSRGEDPRPIDIARLQKAGWTTGRGGTVRGLFAAARESPELVLHYQAWIYRDETRRNKLVKYLWPQLVLLWFLVRFGRRTRMVVHEYRYKLYQGPGAFLQWPMAALLFQLPHALEFHTPQEVDGFKRTFPRRRRIALRDHHQDFVARTQLTPAEARARLRLERGPVVLLLGFFKPHKGFLEFAQAFLRLQAAGRLPAHARVEVVTSIQDAGDQEAVQALARLEGFAARSGGKVRVRVQHLDDEAFDVWLRAADVVALPYLAAFSSGVAARANAVGTPLLARDVGGLATQAGKQGAVYRDDEGLAAGLARLLSASTAR